MRQAGISLPRPFNWRLPPHLFSTMKSFVRTLFETEYFSLMTGILKSGGSAGFFCIFKFPQTAFAHHPILGKNPRGRHEIEIQSL
jgi:hypothetical protein